MYNRETATAGERSGDEIIYFYRVKTSASFYSVARARTSACNIRKEGNKENVI